MPADGAASLGKRGCCTRQVAETGELLSERNQERAVQQAVFVQRSNGRGQRRIDAALPGEQVGFGRQAKSLFHHIVSLEIGGADRRFMEIGNGGLVLALLEGEAAERKEGDTGQ